MNDNHPKPLSVDKFLEEVQFIPSPAFQSRIQSQIHQAVINKNKELAMNSQKKSTEYPNGRKRFGWRWVVGSSVLACLALALMAVSAPAVKAQVKIILQQFGVQLPFTSQGVVISSFVPLAPEQAPAEMKHFAAYDQQADGPVYVELRYFSQDTFIVIDESKAEAGYVLPSGEAIQLGAYHAVVEKNLPGVVFLAKQAPQPWKQAGSGGGGGVDDDTAGAAPQLLNYSQGTRITWVQSGLLVEFLTNLPFDEAIKIAISMKKAPQLHK